VIILRHDFERKYEVP